MKIGRFMVEAIPFKNSNERRIQIARSRNRNVKVRVEDNLIIVERIGINYEKPML